MKKLIRGQKGFTLAEVIVAVAILTLFMGTVGGALFQAFGSQRVIISDGMAIFEERKAFSWFSEDVRMSQTTTLVDGAQPVSSVSLNWTEQYQGLNTAHTSTYMVVSGKLVRTYDGNSTTVANGVVSASFSQSGKVITGQLVVTSKPGTTRTLSVSALMRS